MKIILNDDGFYYKCVFIGIIPVAALLLVGFKDAVSAYVAYIIIGLPIIFLAKLLFSNFFFAEERYMIINDKSLIICYANRFDRIEENKYNISDVRIVYKNIPCLEAITFNDTHPIILYKYMFSFKDYKSLLLYLENIELKNNKG